MHQVNHNHFLSVSQQEARIVTSNLEVESQRCHLGHVYVLLNKRLCVDKLYACNRIEVVCELVEIARRGCKEKSMKFHDL